MTGFSENFSNYASSVKKNKITVENFLLTTYVEKTSYFEVAPPCHGMLTNTLMISPKVNKSVQLRGARKRNFDVYIFFLKYYRYFKEYLYITYQDGFQVNFLDF